MKDHPATEMCVARSGDLIADRYRLDEILGTGGFGTVWRARDEWAGSLVALKRIRLPEELTADERQLARQRALVEARSAVKLRQHPNVVSVDHVVEHDGEPWIVMEYVDGKSLRDVVFESGPLPTEQVALVGMAILDALEAAHRLGILHRDVKPANVMLTHSGQILLTDFGIAKIQGEGTLTVGGAMMGSAGYLAPERIQGAPASPAADLFGLGALLFYAAEGLSAFRVEDLDDTAKILATVTQIARQPRRCPEFGPLLAGLLDKDPANRLSAAQARTILDAIMHPLSPAVVDVTAPWPRAAVSAGSETAITIPMPSRRRRRSAIAGAALAVLTIVAVTIFVVSRLSSDGRAGTPSPSAQHMVGTSPSAVASASNSTSTLLASVTQSDSIWGIAWSPDGTRLATASADGEAKVWSATGELQATLKGHTDFVTDVAWSPDGKHIVTSSYDETAKVWSASGQLQFTLKGHTNWLNAVAWSPDGRHIATASHDHTIKIWSNAGKLEKTLRGHTSSVLAVAWSPDSSRLATGSYDNTARIWSSDGRSLAVLKGHKSDVFGVAWSPKGDRLATAGSYDGTVKIWSSAGKLERTLGSPVKDDTIFDAAWSPDGTRIASTCWGGCSVRIWAASGNLLTTLSGAGELCEDVAWAPDGKRLAASGQEGFGAVWLVG